MAIPVQRFEFPSFEEVTRRELYGMRTLEATRRTIGVVFLAALAALAVTSSESRHATALTVGFAVVAFAHLGLSLRLRAAFNRDREILRAGFGAGPPRRGWDSAWVILVGD